MPCTSCANPRKIGRFQVLLSSMQYNVSEWVASRLFSGGDGRRAMRFEQCVKVTSLVERGCSVVGGGREWAGPRIGQQCPVLVSPWVFASVRSKAGVRRGSFRVVVNVLQGFVTRQGFVKGPSRVAVLNHGFHETVSEAKLEATVSPDRREGLGNGAGLNTTWAKDSPS